MAVRCVPGVICLMLILVAVVPAVADVTIQASATGVQKGGELTFTATTDEPDPVVKVTFTYEGTSASDEDTTSPYQVTRAMDWTTLEDLTVTATFEFQSVGDQQGTVDVDVVDITLLGPATPTRSVSAGWLARTSPTGLSVLTWSWLYDNDLQDVTWDDTINSDQYSMWRGDVVVSGTIQVSAPILGVACTKSMNINVKPRPYTTWTMPIACVEDNEATWGLPPIDQNVALGMIEDRESNTDRIIVPQGTDGNWADGVTLTQVPSGPNAGLWYVRFNTLEIDLETVINQHIKADAPPPDVGEDNFFDHNNDPTNGCIANDMADFVQAVKNHEYRGTPPTSKSLEGHFGRIECEFDQMGDPLPTIEAMLATSESALLAAVNGQLADFEAFLWLFTGHGDWSDAGPNWGGTGSLGSGKHDRYDLQSGWTSGCEWGPDFF